jgi:transcription antitermination protein NusB
VPARSKARKRALDLLFEAELRGEPVLELLEERQNARADDGPPVPEYAAELVRGVQAHRSRIGAYELLWADGVPDGVAISEAVELAKDLSTDGSPVFVNGLLAKLLQLKPTLAL